MFDRIDSEFSLANASSGVSGAQPVDLHIDTEKPPEEQILETNKEEEATSCDRQSIPKSSNSVLMDQDVDDALANIVIANSEYHYGPLTSTKQQSMMSGSKSQSTKFWWDSPQNIPKTVSQQNYINEQETPDFRSHARELNFDQIKVTATPWLTQKSNNN